MKAHKVPATYLSGWEIPTLKDRIYVFYKNQTAQNGIVKRFRDVDRITTEHSYFMEEDFYYIDFSIDGIEYKLEKEINAFFNLNQYTITCEDDLAVVADGESRPIVTINSHETYQKYKDNMKNWSISDSSGTLVPLSDFKDALNSFVFSVVGVIVEENYFANDIENKWNDVRASIIADTTGLSAGNPISITRKNDFFEFYTLQYLRVDRRYDDINPVLDVFKNIFSELGFTSAEIADIEKNGLLSPHPYFYGALLDAARGDKSKINQTISTLYNDFNMDVLMAPTGISFLTSTGPCVTTKRDGSGKTEMIFPLTNQYCIRLRKKTNSSIDTYHVLSDEEVKAINSIIVADTKDIVFSELENISHIV